MIVKLEGMDQLEKMVAEIYDKVSTNPADPEWFNLKDACKRKGVSYNTVRPRPHYQPNGGVPDAILHGVKVWSRDTIAKWLLVTDEQRSSYLKGVAK